MIDKPIIFTPIDYEAYKNSRGFLLEPYDFWTPGPKCTNQTDFEKEILKSLGDNSYFQKERLQIKDLIHFFQDDRSTERVLNLIKEIMMDER